jgi:hypothetical protein
MTQEQFRAVLLDTAEEFTDADLGPLRLHQRASAVRQLTQSGRRVNWSGGRAPRVLAPLAAAAAVVAIVAGAVALSANGVRPHAPAQSASNRAMALLNQVPDPAADAGLPQYYVAIDVDIHDVGYGPAATKDERTVVGDLATGATIKVSLPGLFVEGASVSADDRTFVFLATSEGKLYFYLGRLNTTKRTVSLSRLPIAASSQYLSFGLSPSGTALAVAAFSAPSPRRLLSTVKIYALNGRLLRAWQSRSQVFSPTEGPMAWAQNGMLDLGVLFQGVTVLNVGARGGSLLPATRRVIPSLGPGWTLTTITTIAGNGQTMAAAPVKVLGRGFASTQFVVFSAGTGHVTRRSWLTGSLFAEVVVWDSYSGSEQIVEAPVSVSAKHPSYAYGVLTNGRFVPFLHFPFPNEGFHTLLAF